MIKRNRKRKSLPLNLSTKTEGSEFHCLNKSKQTWLTTTAVTSRSTEATPSCTFHLLFRLLYCSCQDPSGTGKLFMCDFCSRATSVSDFQCAGAWPLMHRTSCCPVKNKTTMRTKWNKGLHQQQQQQRGANAWTIHFNWKIAKKCVVS